LRPSLLHLSFIISFLLFFRSNQSTCCCNRASNHSSFHGKSEPRSFQSSCLYISNYWPQIVDGKYKIICIFTSQLHLFHQRMYIRQFVFDCVTMSVRVANGHGWGWKKALKVISVEFIDYGCSLKSALYHISWWFSEKWSLMWGKRCLNFEYSCFRLNLWKKLSVCAYDSQFNYSCFFFLKKKFFLPDYSFAVGVFDSVQILNLLCDLFFTDSSVGNY
jgi:hypothetical protein